MKLDRLLGILTTLLKNDKVTAPYLAEKFEVSRRTINRDIEALCQAGIPVITQQGSGGGIFIAEGYKLDKSLLTSDELSGIIAALKGIGTVMDKSYLEKTMDKLSAQKEATGSLHEPVIIDLASHYKGSLTEKIQLIKTAVRDTRLVEFDYYYEKGMTHRRLEPYLVVYQWTSWYLFGYCPEKKDWRLFKLMRLWDLSLCEETFVPREIPEEKKNFNESLPDDKPLVALFDPSVRYQLIETYGPHCYTETKDGLLRLEIGYTNREYTISWILGFGDKAKVLKPLDMAKEIKEIVAEIYKKYS